jgi:hypothetical protein
MGIDEDDTIKKRKRVASEDEEGEEVRPIKEKKQGKR